MKAAPAVTSRRKARRNAGVMGFLFGGWQIGFSLTKRRAAATPEGEICGQRKTQAAPKGGLRREARRSEAHNPRVFFRIQVPLNWPAAKSTCSWPFSNL